MHKTVEHVTRRIIERSKATRTAYVEQIKKAARKRAEGPYRMQLPASNLAHDLAGCPSCRSALLDNKTPNIGIITAYNDVISAHQPLGSYPELIKAAVAEVDALEYLVPEMCGLPMADVEATVDDLLETMSVQCRRFVPIPRGARPISEL